MDINSLIVTDAGLAALDNGAWVRDIGGMPGLALKVRGLTSPDVQKAITAKQSALRAKNKGKPLEAEQLAKTMNEILAEQVLTDWEGIEDAGQPVAYDQALATMWITSRNGEKFASIVLRAAQMVDADANAFVEEAGKKLVARLKWALENPDAAETIAAYVRFGQEIPKTLIPPELTDVEWPIWRAFWELSTERGVGMGPGPIPISAIRAAGHALGLQEQFFKPIVRAMDNAYLSHVTGKEKTFSRETMRKG